MTELTHDQTLSHIGVFYHADFVQLYKSYIQADESINWAGPFSQLRRGSTSEVGTLFFGYVLITSYRVICIRFAAKYNLFGGGIRPKIRVHPDENAWVCIPQSPLTRKEIEGRKVQEFLLKDILRVERKDWEKLQGVINTILVQLNIHLSTGKWDGNITLYNSAAGQHVYQLLQKAMQPAVIQDRVEFIPELERLAALHKSGALTDTEFQDAKRMLFGK
jgi:hypothetical protein